MVLYGFALLTLVFANRERKRERQKETAREQERERQREIERERDGSQQKVIGQRRCAAVTAHQTAHREEGKKNT